MAGWVLMALPLFLLVGSWFSKKKGTKYGFVWWIVFFAVVLSVDLLSEGWEFVLVFVASVVISLTGCISFYKILSRYSIVKTILKHDHDGLGCAFLAVTFILLIHLTIPLFREVFSLVITTLKGWL